MQGQRAVRDFQRALHQADAVSLQGALEHILLASPSFFDLVNENSYHMLLLGLCFGIEGYEPPVSNREAGHGRCDIQLIPEKDSYITAAYGQRPFITIEVKHLASGLETDVSGSLTEKLSSLAEAALAQIDDRAYDAATHGQMHCVRWGIAFSGKHVACACRAE